MGAREQFDSVFSDTVSGGTVSMKVVEHEEPARAALTEAANGYDLIIVGCGSEWGLGQRTLVVATHRLPVLKWVDRIVVIDGGRIVMDGSKDQMLGKLAHANA